MNKTIERLMEGNVEYQRKLLEAMEEIDEEKKKPRYPILIITCMDPRVDVHRIFQLEPGDIFVLRNAGNIFTKDILRSILLAVHEYHIEEIVFLGHTDCGMTKIDINELKEKLTHISLKNICRKGINPLLELRKFFRLFVDELKNIHNQIENLKKYKGFPIGIDITGMLYDTKTGWVFTMDDLKTFDYIEEFQYHYSELLENKRYTLMEYLGEEPEAPEKLEVLSKPHLEEPISEVKPFEAKPVENFMLKEIPIYDSPGSNSIPLSKIRIPKIRIPKIKVHIPYTHKKEAE